MDAERISPHSAGNAAEAQQDSAADILIDLAIGLNPAEVGTPIANKALPLPALVERLTSHTERDNKMGPYFCCPMSRSARNGADAQPWRLFCFDFDGKSGARPDPEKSKDFFAPWFHVGYSTHSYTPENGKHRVVLLLDRKVTPVEYRELFDAWAEICLFEPDNKLNHPDQPVFLPSCPPGGERLGWVNEGGSFEVDTFLDGYRAQQKTESRASTEWKPSGDSVIAAFNAAHTVVEILERNEYQCRGKRYQHPNSQSGMAGLTLLKDGRLCFSHSNDALGDGKPHDAFDVWRILEGKGDTRQAVKEAARLLGIDWKPSDSGKDRTQKSSSESHDQKPGGDFQVELIQGSDIRPESIDWLWEGWLAKGKFHVLAGPPGTGKTTIATALAAALTSGSAWPDRVGSTPGNVIIWSGEDDPKDTLAPRLIASGADMGRVWFIGDVHDEEAVLTFDPSIHLASLEKVARGIGGVDLLIVDPIVSAIAGDSHKNAEVRRGLQPLVTLGAALGCAVLGITHFTKGTAGRDPVERVNGSIAFGALARVVFAAAKMPENDREGGSRLFCRSKSNIGADEGGFRYDLEQVELPEYPGVWASRLLWGVQEEGSARDLLARAEASKTEDEAEVISTNEVDDWLREYLAHGPKSAKEIYKDGRADGYSKDQLKRAKDRLKAVTGKHGYQGPWSWSLPEGTFSKESEQREQESPNSNTVRPFVPLTEPSPAVASSDCTLCDGNTPLRPLKNPSNDGASSVFSFQRSEREHHFQSVGENCSLSGESEDAGYI